MTSAEQDIINLYSRLRIEREVYDRRQQQAAEAQSQRDFFKKCGVILTAVIVAAVLFI